MATHDKPKASLNNKKAVSEKARTRCTCSQIHGQVPHSYAPLEEDGQDEEGEEQMEKEEDGSSVDV
jgi:hypothetical protein